MIETKYKSLITIAPKLAVRGVDNQLRKPLQEISHDSVCKFENDTKKLIQVGCSHLPSPEEWKRQKPHIIYKKLNKIQKESDIFISYAFKNLFIVNNRASLLIHVVMK